MKDFAWWFAVGVANLVNILDPDVVVVGGGLTDAGECPSHRRGRVAEPWCWHPTIGRWCRSVAAAFGPEAGAIGAALLARDRPW